MSPCIESMEPLTTKCIRIYPTCCTWPVDRDVWHTLLYILIIIYNHALVWFANYDHVFVIYRTTWKGSNPIPFFPLHSRTCNEIDTCSYVCMRSACVD